MKCAWLRVTITFNQHGKPVVTSKPKHRYAVKRITEYKKHSDSFISPFKFDGSIFYAPGQVITIPTAGASQNWERITLTPNRIYLNGVDVTPK